MPVIKRRIDAFQEGRLIPRRRYPKPMRFVGLGVILMILIVFLMNKIIIK
jgi:hypothetical protein